MAKTKKQTELPGIEKPKHPELDTLMEEHAELAGKLGETRQRMGELNEQMMAKAKELGLAAYRNETAVPPLLLTVTQGTTKVKVKAAHVAEDVDVDEVEAAVQ